MLWDLQGWAGVRDSRGALCGYLPVLWEGVSEARSRRSSTYDKVDGLGERVCVGDRAERTRLLVRDTLGMVRMSASVEDEGDGIP